MKKLFLLIMICLVFISSFCLALQISPAILDLPYSDTEPVEFSIDIINDDSRDILVEVSYESYEGKIDYANYFEITNDNDNIIEVAQNERKTVNFRMNYPEMENFGNVRFAFVKFYQIPEGSGQITATVALLIPLRADIPYPPKFISITAPNYFYVKNGETVELNATIQSKGIEMINVVSGHFDIIKGDYKKEVNFDTLYDVTSGSINVVKTNLNTIGMDAGIYDLNVTVDYDGTEKTLSGKKLIIGEETVEIIDLTPKELVNNQVNSLKLTLMNLWAEDLSPAISFDLINKNGAVIKTYDAGTYTLPVSEYKDIFYGLDLLGVESGDYILKVNLNLEGNIVTKDFNVIISDKPKSEAGEINSYFVYVIVFGVIILILIGIIAYLFYKNNKEN